MKINNIEKGVPPLDVFSTFLPLYSVLNTLGLSSVYRDKGRIKISPLLWKSSLIFILLILTPLANVICSYTKIFTLPTEGTFLTMVIIFHLVYNFQYLVDVYFVYKYGRECFIHYISIYQCIDKSLGRTCYKKIKKSVTKICVFLLVVFLVAFVFHSISFFLNMVGIGAAIKTLEVSFYFLDVLNALDIISNAIQVKYRLKMIADLLKDYYDHTDYMSGVFQNVSYKVFVTNTNDLDAPKQTSDNHNIIMGLNRCYLLLIKQCYYINTMFGARILLHNFLFAIDMVMLLNLMKRFIFGIYFIEYSWLRITATIAGLLALFIIFYCEVHYCEQTYRQTERITVWSENLLKDKKLSPDVKDALKELNSLVQLKPITFHVLHFYKIKYGIIISIASAIVTYTIILLQNIT